MRGIHRTAVAVMALSLSPVSSLHAQTAVRAVNPADLPKPNGYAHVIEAPAGRTLHISGQLPLDKDGNLVGKGDFAAQARQVFANLKTALQASGATFQDVVKLNMFVTDMNQLKALRAARDEYIDSKHPPASTLVEVNRFVKEGAMVEIDAVAVLP